MLFDIISQHTNCIIVAKKLNVNNLMPSNVLNIVFNAQFPITLVCPGRDLAENLFIFLLRQYGVYKKHFGVYYSTFDVQSTEIILSQWKTLRF